VAGPPRARDAKRRGAPAGETGSSTPRTVDRPPCAPGSFAALRITEWPARRAPATRSGAALPLPSGQARSAWSTGPFLLLFAPRSGAALPPVGQMLGARGGRTGA